MNLCPRSYIRFMCVNVSLSLFVCLCVVWDQVFRVHLLRLIRCDIIDILDFLRYSRFAECHIDILIVNGILFILDTSCLTDFILQDLTAFVFLYVLYVTISFLELLIFSHPQEEQKCTSIFIPQIRMKKDHPLPFFNNVNEVCSL